MAEGGFSPAGGPVHLGARLAGVQFRLRAACVCVRVLAPCSCQGVLPRVPQPVEPAVHARRGVRGYAHSGCRGSGGN